MEFETIRAVIESHGVVIFFALGFAEFIGIPVASVPVLVTGGALARMAMGSVADSLVLVAAAAAGGLVADAILFGLTRWKGSVMVDAACGLTSNPSACVLYVTERVERVGPVFIVVGKLLPGVGNLIGPAAALAGVGLLPFLLGDVVALLLWASVYMAVGWLFSYQIEALLVALKGSLIWVVPVGVVVIGLAGLWRIWRVQVHTKLHEETREEV